MLEVRMVQLCLLVIRKFYALLIYIGFDRQNLIKSFILFTHVEDEAACCETTVVSIHKETCLPFEQRMVEERTVSYTHLTLPTKA